MKIINIALVFALCAQIFSGCNAGTMGNYAEIGVAVAALSVDLAAEAHEFRYAEKGTTKNLHTLADLLHVLRESLFFYNNAVARKSHGPLHVYNQDWILNTAFVAHDFSRLYRRFMPVKTKNNSDDAMAALEIIDQHDEKQALELIDCCKKLFLPAVKGLTAIGIACAQEDATSWGKHRYAGENLRALMQATHSFSRLLEEYTLLKEDSKYRYHIIVALCANVAWIVYEFKEYTKQLELYRLPEQPLVPYVMRRGECGICLIGEKDLMVLHCDHAYCHDCLRGWLRRAYRERRSTATMHLTPCFNPACEQDLLRGDLKNIMRGANIAETGRILDAYDESRFVVHLRNHVASVLSSEEEERRLREGAKRCPGCRLVVERSGGCDHMTCPCGAQFCMICGIEWERYPNDRRYRGHPGIDPSVGGFRCPRAR